jgi:hypothetical protein
VVNAVARREPFPSWSLPGRARRAGYGTFSFMLAHFMDQLNKKNSIDIVRVPLAAATRWSTR